MFRHVPPVTSHMTAHKWRFEQLRKLYLFNFLKICVSCSNNSIYITNFSNAVSDTGLKNRLLAFVCQMGFFIHETVGHTAGHNFSIARRFQKKNKWGKGHMYKNSQTILAKKILLLLHRYKIKSYLFLLQGQDAYLRLIGRHLVALIALLQHEVAFLHKPECWQDGQFLANTTNVRHINIELFLP